MTSPNISTKKEISIPYPLYQSEKGKYFIGQTPIFTDNLGKSLAVLVNPTHSKVNIYLNAITVTNIAELNLSAQIYINSTFDGGSISNMVGPANAAYFSSSIPNGIIKYLSSSPLPPSNGTSIFSRIVSPYSTEIIDGSQIIIPEGKSLIVYLGGYLPAKSYSVIVAFGWWEEKICNCHCN